MKSLAFFIVMIYCLCSSWASEVKIYSKELKEEITTHPIGLVWKRIPSVTVPLSPQNMVDPTGGGSVVQIEVKSLYASERVLLHISWEDKTNNSRLEPGVFTDAAAIQLPLNSSGDIPPLLMGSEENPVAIWRWNAVDQSSSSQATESLIASGFGTVAPRKTQDVYGIGIYNEGRWQVVINIKVKYPKANSAIPIAFAVWDGGSMERGSEKNVSAWQWLVIGEANPPQGESDVEKGRLVFDRYGCAACHGPGGKGGIKNPNAQGGLVPPINWVKEGFLEEELKKVIREGRVSQLQDPNGSIPPLRMNSWKTIMDEKELDALVKYLFSLIPKEEGEEW